MANFMMILISLLMGSFSIASNAIGIQLYNKNKEVFDKDKKLKMNKTYLIVSLSLSIFFMLLGLFMGFKMN